MFYINVNVISFNFLILKHILRVSNKSNINVLFLSIKDYFILWFLIKAKILFGANFFILDISILRVFLF